MPVIFTGTTTSDLFCLHDIILVAVGYTYLKFMKTDWEQIVASLACRKILWWIWTLHCLCDNMDAEDWTDTFNHFFLLKRALMTQSNDRNWVQLRPPWFTVMNHLIIQNIQSKMYYEKKGLSVWFYTVLAHASDFFFSKLLWHAYLYTSAHVRVRSMCECNERMLACFSSRRFQSISWGLNKQLSFPQASVKPSWASGHAGSNQHWHGHSVWGRDGEGGRVHSLGGGGVEVGDWSQHVMRGGRGGTRLGREIKQMRGKMERWSGQGKDKERWKTEWEKKVRDGFIGICERYKVRLQRERKKQWAWAKEKNGTVLLKRRWSGLGCRDRKQKKRRGTYLL